MRKIILTLVFLMFATCAQAEELTISAAASLTDAFTDIEKAFEAANPDIDLVMNFASSGALYRQIEQGAPTDVYASANVKWMDKAEAKSFIEPGTRADFAMNSLVLATPADNEAGVASVQDLTGEKVSRIGIGAPETVPAGQYAKKSLESLGLYETLTPKYIFAESVRQVLDYLRRQEVDAGFVYRTDAIKGGDAVKVIADMPLDKPALYPIGMLKESPRKEAAKKFIDFVLGPEGAMLLQARGFTPAVR